MTKEERDLVPKSVKVLGKTVKIICKPMDTNLGSYDRDERIIYLDSEQSAEGALSTLTHEFLHAILAIGGFAFSLKRKQEESLVRLLESGLEGFVKFK